MVEPLVTELGDASFEPEHAIFICRGRRSENVGVRLQFPGCVLESGCAMLLTLFVVVCCLHCVAPGLLRHKGGMDPLGLPPKEKEPGREPELAFRRLQSTLEEPTPEPTPAPTAAADLTAYWDMGNCGPYGNDNQKDWCPGNPGICPSQIAVDTSVCSSSTAVLSRLRGTGRWASVTIDGCTYAFFAEYACTQAPTPEPTLPQPEVAFSVLLEVSDAEGFAISSANHQVMISLLASGTGRPASSISLDMSVSSLTSFGEARTRTTVGTVQMGFVITIPPVEAVLQDVLAALTSIDTSSVEVAIEQYTGSGPVTILDITTPTVRNTWTITTTTNSTTMSSMTDTSTTVSSMTLTSSTTGTTMSDSTVTVTGTDTSLTASMSTTSASTLSLTAVEPRALFSITLEVGNASAFINDAANHQVLSAILAAALVRPTSSISLEMSEVSGKAGRVQMEFTVAIPPIDAVVQDMISQLAGIEADPTDAEAILTQATSANTLSIVGISSLVIRNTWTSTTASSSMTTTLTTNSDTGTSTSATTTTSGTETQTSTTTFSTLTLTTASITTLTTTSFSSTTITRTSNTTTLTRTTRTTQTAFTQTDTTASATTRSTMSSSKTTATVTQTTASKTTATTTSGTQTTYSTSFASSTLTSSTTVSSTTDTTSVTLTSLTRTSVTGTSRTRTSSTATSSTTMTSTSDTSTTTATSVTSTSVTKTFTSATFSTTSPVSLTSLTLSSSTATSSHSVTSTTDTTSTTATTTVTTTTVTTASTISVTSRTTSLTVTSTTTLTTISETSRTSLSSTSVTTDSITSTSSITSSTRTTNSFTTITSTTTLTTNTHTFTSSTTLTATSTTISSTTTITSTTTLTTNTHTFTSSTTLTTASMTSSSTTTITYTTTLTTNTETLTSSTTLTTASMTFSSTTTITYTTTLTTNTITDTTVTSTLTTLTDTTFTLSATTSTASSYTATTTTRYTESSTTSNTATSRTHTSQTLTSTSESTTTQTSTYTDTNTPTYTTSITTLTTITMTTFTDTIIGTSSTLIGTFSDTSRTSSTSRTTTMTTITTSTTTIWQICSTGVPTGSAFDTSDCSDIYTMESCTVGCQAGYVGASETFTCQQDTSFMGATPACGRVQCTGGVSSSLGLDTSACNGTLDIGDRCTVRCNPGYVTQESVYECRIDGTLDGELPICERLECDEASLPSMLSGTNLTSCLALKAGDTCTTTCSAGYEGDPSNLTCALDGVFGGSGASCELQVCEVPALFNVSSFTNDCAGVKHGGSCNVECGFGYEGDFANFLCQFGVLQGIAPTCIALECTRNLPYGLGVNDTDCQEKRTGETCTPTCVFGYATAGNTTFTSICGLTQERTLTDSGIICERRMCDDLAATVPAYAAAGVELHGCSGARYHDTCEASCAEGYESSVQMLKCSGTGLFVAMDAALGTWSVNPAGLNCVPKPCAYNPQTYRMGVDASHCSGRVTGETCFLTAATGYRYASGNSTVQTCMPNGMLTGTEPDVEARYCTMPSYDEGRVLLQCDTVMVGEACNSYCDMPTYFGSDGGAGVVKYICNNEYLLVAEASIACVQQRRRLLEGAIDGEVHLKNEVESRMLSAVCDASAIISGPSAEAYDNNCAATGAGGVCSVFCADGYDGDGLSFYQCNAATGFFESLGGSLPQCVAKPCVWGIPSGLGVEHNCENATTGQTCNATCMSGYTTANSSTTGIFTCQGSQELSGVAPICEAQTCNTPNFPKEYSFGSCIGQTVGQECFVSCASGYTGSPGIVVCGASGLFEGTLPICEGDPCTSGVPSGSDLNATACHGLTTDQSCEVTCGNGYAGAAQNFTCQHHNSLTGDVPVCEIQTCDTSDLPVAVGLAHTCSATEYLSSCGMYCDDNGYQLVPGQSAQTWSCNWGHAEQRVRLGGVAPQCEGTVCQDNIPMGDMYVHNCSGVRTDQHCVTACAAGYTANETNLVCQRSGALSGGRPTCHEMPCPHRTVPHVLTSSCEGATFGSTCTVVCEDGYQGGSRSWTCDVDVASNPATVSLQGEVPACIPSPCHDNFPTGLLYVDNCSDVVTGSSCLVECAAAYEGTAQSWSCLPNGTIAGSYPSCRLSTTATTITATSLSGTATVTSTSATTTVTATDTVTTVAAGTTLAPKRTVEGAFQIVMEFADTVDLEDFLSHPDVQHVFARIIAVTAGVPASLVTISLSGALADNSDGSTRRLDRSPRKRGLRGLPTSGEGRRLLTNYNIQVNYVVAFPQHWYGQYAYPDAQGIESSITVGLIQTELAAQGSTASYTIVGVILATTTTLPHTESTTGFTLFSPPPPMGDFSDDTGQAGSVLIAVVTLSAMGLIMIAMLGCGIATWYLRGRRGRDQQSDACSSSPETLIQGSLYKVMKEVQREDTDEGPTMEVDVLQHAPKQKARVSEASMLSTESNEERQPSEPQPPTRSASPPGSGSEARSPKRSASPPCSGSEARSPKRSASPPGSGSEATSSKRSASPPGSDSGAGSPKRGASPPGSDSGPRSGAESQAESCATTSSEEKFEPSNSPRATAAKARGGNVTPIPEMAEEQVTSDSSGFNL